MRNKNSCNTIYVLTYAESSWKGGSFVSSFVAIIHWRLNYVHKIKLRYFLNWICLVLCWCFPHNQEKLLRVCFQYQNFWTIFLYFQKKLSKYAWFCSGFVPHNQEHPTSDHQDDKLKPKSVILTPFPGALLALWKCPLLVLPPYKPSQKAKKL